MKPLQPFKIEIPQSTLDDLQSRLDNTRWPDQLPGTGWDNGVAVDYITKLVDYWRNQYDWRKWEARINQYPQFVTKSDGPKIHFLHIVSPEPNATPLILTHGWPGSVVEYLDVIESLSNPVAHGGNAADAFHLVIPSLPGYGFSGPTRETGWNNYRIAKT